jgi:hypothetical protein
MQKSYLTPEDVAGLHPGVLDEVAVDLFTNGRCASMALALHRLTGWEACSFVPLGCFYHDNRFPAHAVVDSPKGFLHASGFITLKDWARLHNLHDDGYRVCLDNLAYAEENLDLAMPFAKAVLERYFPGFFLSVGTLVEGTSSA